jgi:hypothetical protein
MRCGTGNFMLWVAPLVLLGLAALLLATWRYWR